MLRIPKNRTLFILAWLIVPLFASFVTGDEIPDVNTNPRQPAARWWKGNIHTHSLWSDGDDFPEMIAEWYQVRDYNFLALSDHNILSQGDHWMGHHDIVSRGGKDVVNKYVERFGLHWVETRERTSEAESASAQPENQPPKNEANAKGDYEIRLKPFSEYRALVEQRDQFLMIPGEEISDSVGGAPIHMNVTNVQQLVQPLGGESVSAAIEANMRAVADQAKRTGREMIVHLNHPNFGYGVSAEDIAHAVSEKFFEVYNGHPGVNQLGDETHPNIEQLWDIANTIRLGQLGAAPLYGMATDDSHHYHGGNVSPGRGWIMVRAHHLTAESLIRAMKRGDFYASSGVRIENASFDSASNDAPYGNICLEIDAQDGVTYTTRFIGTPRGAVVDNDSISTVRTDSTAGESDETASDRLPLVINMAKVGIVFATVSGPTPSYRLNGTEFYVRAIVTSDEDHPNPSYPGQKQSAWTQPVGWSLDR